MGRFHEELMAVSLREAARRIDVSLPTLKRMLRRGQLRAVRVGLRRRVVPVLELRRLLGTGPADGA